MCSKLVSHNSDRSRIYRYIFFTINCKLYLYLWPRRCRMGRSNKHYSHQNTGIPKSLCWWKDKDIQAPPPWNMRQSVIMHPYLPPRLSRYSRATSSSCNTCMTGAGLERTRRATRTKSTEDRMNTASSTTAPMDMPTSLPRRSEGKIVYVKKVAHGIPHVPATYQRGLGHDLSNFRLWIAYRNLF